MAEKDQKQENLNNANEDNKQEVKDKDVKQEEPITKDNKKKVVKTTKSEAKAEEKESKPDKSTKTKVKKPATKVETKKTTSVKADAKAEEKKAKTVKTTDKVEPAKTDNKKNKPAKKETKSEKPVVKNSASKTLADKKSNEKKAISKTKPKAKAKNTAVVKKDSKPAKKQSTDKKQQAKAEIVPAKNNKPAPVSHESKKVATIDTKLVTTSEAHDKKPKENALIRSYRANKRAWKDALIVVGALALFGVGYGLGHATTGNNPTIAVISKGRGANHKVKQQDIDHQLNNTKYAHSIANQQLTLKVLATLYPKQYDKYTQKAQKYIKAQQRTYGGARNYQQVLSANNSSEADVVNNYLLTQMITVSVMHHNKPTKADLQSIYKKSDNNAYKLSGVLVRTKDEAKAVLESVHNGSSYKSMKNKINKNDFAYFNRSTPDMKDSMTLQEMNSLDSNLANGVSQMKVGETAIIKNGQKNYFIITLKSKNKQSFKASQSRLKDKYTSNLMLKGYGPIQKALKADYKRAGVKVTDTKQFGDIAQVQNFYGNNGLNAGN